MDFWKSEEGPQKRKNGGMALCCFEGDEKCSDLRFKRGLEAG